jgi:hypothetical protein
MPVACLIVLLGLIRGDVPVPPGFTESPAYVSLFTPRGVPDGAYQTFTSTEDLDTVIARLRADPSVRTASGSFSPQSVIAADAFGQSGRYNRTRLARLFGARRARVARGPRTDNGQVVEAWTLLSPYPDPSFDRLMAGTLLIVLRLQP